MHFKGKVAIVTGGSSGIGKETAKRLVAHGASVVLSGRDEAELQCAAKEVSSDPSVVRTFAGDIGKPATGLALVDLAEKQFGGLDILVSNAGVFKTKPFLELTPRPGLYLCGASTPPGGGVHGMAGYHAAVTALADLRDAGS